MKQLTIKTAEFLDYVRTIKSRGVTEQQAWDIATGTQPRLHRIIALENSLPEGARLSSDGQQIISDWPVPVDVLRKLGLPDDATQKEYELYRRAEAYKATPDAAAWLVRELISFEQLTNATTFKDAMDFLKKHRPQLAELASQAQQKTS